MPAQRAGRRGRRRRDRRRQRRAGGGPRRGRAAPARAQRRLRRGGQPRLRPGRDARGDGVRAAQRRRHRRAGVAGPLVAELAGTRVGAVQPKLLIAGSSPATVSTASASPSTATGRARTSAIGEAGRPDRRGAARHRAVHRRRGAAVDGLRRRPRRVRRALLHVLRGRRHRPAWCGAAGATAAPRRAGCGTRAACRRRHSAAAGRRWSSATGCGCCGASPTGRRSSPACGSPSGARCTPRGCATSRGSSPGSSAPPGGAASAAVPAAAHRA